VYLHGGFLNHLSENVKEDIDAATLQQMLYGWDKSGKLPVPRDLFYANEIRLSEAYSTLLHSLYTSEYSARLPFYLMEGKTKRRLHEFEQSKKAIQILNERFEKTRKILNSTNDDAERFKSASLWYLEGHCTENETLLKT